MKYKKWEQLNLIQKTGYWLIICILGAIFVYPLAVVLIFLLKITGVI